MNLQGVNLRGAHLCDAQLIGSNFRQADLFGAVLCRANLSQTILQKANLFGANLWGANLQRANLTEANLYSANLRRANISQARLARVSCKRATLEGALLTDATNVEVDLKDADLTHKDLAKARQGNIVACTEISVLQDTFSEAAVDHLCDAAQAFMTACGFEYHGTVETANRPFFQLVKFWSQHPCSIETLDRIYAAGGEALQHTFDARQSGQAANNWQTVSAQLLVALIPFDNTLLRLGELLVIKWTLQGQPCLCVASLAPDLAHQLTLDPSLLRKPEEAMSLAIKVHQGQKAIAE
jgi:hypothetical protein